MSYTNPSTEKSKATNRWPKKFVVQGLTITQNASTRRLRRLAFKQATTLRRIKKLLARQQAQRDNLDNRLQVKTLKAAKRLPHLRVRSKDQLEQDKILDPIRWIRDATGKVTSVNVWRIYAVAFWGIRKIIVDFHPIESISPPRNTAKIGSFRINSLKASVELNPSILLRPRQFMPKSKWPIWGLEYIGIDSSMPQPIAFDHTIAGKALQKALAKVYEAEIQTNEYLIEWKQVCNLVRDPLKTLLTFHRVLERWTRRDAWMYIPERRYRKFGKGTLVSKTPTGGVLMSMRTRKEVSVDTVSTTVLTAACNRWLQYRYGIAPIVSDLTKLYDLWLRPVTVPHVRSASARYWVSKPPKVFSTHATIRGPWYFTFKREKVKGEFYSAKVWYKFKAEVPTAYKCGLHPSQWLNILWNSIPYSFVADWVINLDEWMTSQRDVPWIELCGNVVTHKLFEHARSTCTGASDTSYGEKGVISGSPIAICYRESIHRKIDLPRTLEPFLSTAWSSVKNAMTAATLVVAPLGQQRLITMKQKGK